MTERLLHEPLAPAPLVLAEQHGPKPTIVGSDVEDLVRDWAATAIAAIAPSSSSARTPSPPRGEAP